MDRLFSALRKNPDAVALAVLCLVLGIGRQVSHGFAAAGSSPTPVGLHCILADRAEEALSAIDSGLGSSDLDLSDVLDILGR